MSTFNCKLKVSVAQFCATFMDHNQTVIIWEADDGDNCKSIWVGPVWKMPEDIGDKIFKRLFGVVADSIIDSDRINIEVYREDKAREYERESASVAQDSRGVEMTAYA